MSEVELASVIAAALASPWGRQWPTDIDKHNAALLLATLRSHDSDAGIYRVSLDAAIEAAAKREYDAYVRSVGRAAAWEDLNESLKRAQREGIRALVTAAVMGGAQ